MITNIKATRNSVLFTATETNILYYTISYIETWRSDLLGFITCIINDLR